MKVSVVVPTYNEASNIGILLSKIKEVLQKDFEVIVVDDNSPDGTAEIARKAGEEFTKVIVRKNERGLSSAVVKGIKEAKGDFICVMDADLQHPPETIRKMVEAGEKTGADIVIASRYVRGGKIKNWPLMRRIISRGAVFLAHIFLPSTRKIGDPLSGFFMIRKKVMTEKINPIGYKILLEILVNGNYSKVCEVPYTFMSRKFGESKLSGREFLNYLKHLWKLTREDGEFFSFLKFVFVGITGIFVNEVVSVLLAKKINYVTAGLIGLEAGILNNFIWNHLWSFKDRKTKLTDAFLKFHLFRLANFPIVALLLPVFSRFFPFYIANLLAILIVFTYNYLTNTFFVWEARKYEYCTYD